MKKLIYTMLGLILITSCAAPQCDCENSANGFVLPGQSVNMGSEATVDVFKKIDAAWMVRDYETMKAHIADEGNYRFEDGTVVTNGEDFVAKVEEQYQKDLADGVAWGWNTDYAFSVYPSKTEMITGMKKVNG